MPGAVMAADELLELAVAANKKVARHFHALDALEVGVLVPVELIGKEALHRVATIVSGWQTDGVQHDQINRCSWRSKAEIWRSQPTRKLVPAVDPKR